MANTNTFCLISISNLKTGRFETIRFETWRFVNLTFSKPDVLKPDVLKPDVLKPDVLWVHPQNVRFQNVWNVRFTKRQVYKTSGLQNVSFTKRQVFKTSGCKINIHLYSVLVVGGNLQVLLQPCLQAKWWLCFILYFRGFFAIYYHNK